jgi:cyanate permease
MLAALFGIWAAERYTGLRARMLNFGFVLVGLSILVGVALCSGCSKPTPPRKVQPISREYDAVTLAGNAKAEVIAIGTLSTFGSFEWGTAPLATLAAASLKHIPQMLHDGTLTPDEAQTMINGAVKVRDLVKEANAECAQNGHTGKCTGDTATAQATADQAKAESVKACLNLNDQEILKCLHHL